MTYYTSLKRLIQKRLCGLLRCSKICGVSSTDKPYRYAQDGLYTFHETDFLKDPQFIKSYARGVQAVGGDDYNWHWRVHVGLWVAGEAAQLDGDFVECGVFRGFLMSSICTRLDWNSSNKSAWLLDTYNGYDLSQLNAAERAGGRVEENARYTTDCYQSVLDNFAEWERVHLVKGIIPETLTRIGTEKIAYLSIDMNNAAPEIAALRYLWPKLVPGAWVLLDDYAFHGYHEQYKAMNKLAAELGVTILSLPTGQGIIRKPS